MDTDQFYQLATKMLSGEITKEEENIFTVYLKDSQYKELFERLQRHWKQGGDEYGQNEFSLERSLQKLRFKIERYEKSQESPKSFLKKAMRVAAGFAIFIAVGYMGTHFYNNINEQKMDVVAIKSVKGERKKVVLPDSSIVYLNTNSSIAYDEAFNTKERHITLKGEAFFYVKRNPKKPFVIQYGDFKTTVLGTSFNISTFGEKVAVTVKSGKVKTENTIVGTSVILLKDDRATFNVQTNSFEKNVVKPFYFTDWHRNILRLDEIPMADAIKIIEDWYGVQIQCTSNEILSRKVRASFADKPIEDVLNKLQFIIGFDYQIINNTITIKPKL